MTPRWHVLRSRTVLIRNGKIVSVNGASCSAPSHGARRINARGKWLMPGLTDMHVHIENDQMLRLDLGDMNLPAGTVKAADELLPYVAQGVLQVANLSSMPGTLAQRDAVDSGDIIGPHIAAAAMIDGAPPTLPRGETLVATTPEGGRQAVRDIKDEGYDFVKVYSSLDLPTFTAIVKEAARQGLKVDGHIPGRGQGLTDQFLQPGFGMVAHAEEYAFQSRTLSDADIARFAAIAKERRIWLTTTLSVDERILAQMRDPNVLLRWDALHYLNPMLRWLRVARSQYVQNRNSAAIARIARIVDFNRRLVRAFAAAGIPIVAGSDTTIGGGVPGFALHDELEAMARAGLNNRQILEATTNLPAEWLGTIKDRGTVEPGKRADLLLLDADPQKDVANTRRIAAVIVGGRYLSRSDLDQRMRALRRRNDAHPYPDRRPIPPIKEHVGTGNIN